MVQRDGGHHGPALDGRVDQLGIGEDFGAEADVRLALDHRLADLAGHAGGELKVAAGVGLLELAAQTGHGGDDEQRNGLQAEGPHSLSQHLEVPQAAVSQGYNLLGLGEQGGAVPAQGNPPAAFLKQGDPQLLLQGRDGVAETGL